MSKPVMVTDHAVVRYLQRIRGLDIEAVREEIRVIVGPAVNLGARMYSQDGVTYAIRDRTVTTVADSRSPNQFRQRATILAGRQVRAQR